MKVIIGVDDSPHSRAALEMVRKMRWPAGTHFAVLCAAPIVIPVYATADGGMGTYIQDLQDAQDQDARLHEELAGRVERELRNAGLSTKGHVDVGDPREAILRLAAAEHADLIVVGSHGRTGLRKMLMGSVASHVVAHAPCSVLVVKIGRAHV